MTKRNKPTMNVSVDVEVLKWLDSEATARHVTRAALVSSLMWEAKREREAGAEPDPKAKTPRAPATAGAAPTRRSA